MVPVAAVSTALGILLFLALILGDVHTTRIIFTEVSGFPDKLDLQRSYELTSVSFWWLFLVYTVWVIAAIAIITGFMVARQSLMDSTERFRKNALFVLASSMIMMAIILYQIDATLISVQDIIHHVRKLATGMRTLIEMTTGVAITALFGILVCTSILLCPPHDEAVIARKLRLLNILLYTGAILLLIWIMQSRALYSFAAASLITEQQQKVEQIAPTISLVVGGVASILLGLMYMSSYLWLHNLYRKLSGNMQKIAGTKNDEDKHSPGHIFLSSWARVIAVMGPMLPGIVEVFTKFDSLI